jgi:hypothetical protein
MTRSQDHFVLLIDSSLLVAHDRAPLYREWGNLCQRSEGRSSRTKCAQSKENQKTASLQLETTQNEDLAILHSNLRNYKMWVDRCGENNRERGGSRLLRSNAAERGDFKFEPCRDRGCRNIGANDARKSPTQ